LPDGSNRYDGNKPNPHPHAVCIKCKKIVDPDLDSVDEKKKLANNVGVSVADNQNIKTVGPRFLRSKIGAIFF